MKWIAFSRTFADGLIEWIKGVFGRPTRRSARWSIWIGLFCFCAYFFHLYFLVEPTTRSEIVNGFFAVSGFYLLMLRGLLVLWITLLWNNPMGGPEYARLTDLPRYYYFFICKADPDVET